MEVIIQLSYLLNFLLIVQNTSFICFSIQTTSSTTPKATTQQTQLSTTTASSTTLLSSSTAPNILKTLTSPYSSSNTTSKITSGVKAKGKNESSEKNGILAILSALLFNNGKTIDSGTRSKHMTVVSERLDLDWP